MYIYIDCFTLCYDWGYNQVTKSGGKKLFSLSKFCYHDLTVHGVILLILFHHGNHTCGVISLFEVNIIYKVTLWNEKYEP